jgi:hypothetical protein
VQPDRPEMLSTNLHRVLLLIVLVIDSYYSTKLLTPTSLSYLWLPEILTAPIHFRLRIRHCDELTAIFVTILKRSNNRDFFLPFKLVTRAPTLAPATLAALPSTRRDPVTACS